MGCVSSKQANSSTPASEFSGVGKDHGSGVLPPPLKSSGGFEELWKREEEEDQKRQRSRGGSGKLRKGSFNSGSSLSARLGNLQKYVEAEQVAAGWPAWLSAVAGEAIQGWVPLRADAFEKLEKVGQGTYSSVYRARDIETGKMVALKKVRFDNFQPESVRFMAREIKILRKLDHPNIMKLEGIITSRLSCSIYLVFEYMEHDLTGLLSSPDIQFSESQIKCYMKQLLSGIEHCHSQGIMHRDIKSSNILVNNEGVLKVADFGLANVFSSKNRKPLTSRVVTLWYRPPELILGSTNYGSYVDLWSVGCVFAELLFGKPLLKGKTEVEQLHKIFKLCGSPPEEYWKRSKLPHATLFKPQRPYESSLREICTELPEAAIKLMETFLSIEPQKRGTASSALKSEYFLTEPYACESSSLPKYSPNKEIDAKSREQAERKKAGLKVQDSVPARRPRRVRKALQEPSSGNRFVPTKGIQGNRKLTHRSTRSVSNVPTKQSARHGQSRKTSCDTLSEISQLTNTSQGDITFANPLQVPASTGFSWAKSRKENLGRSCTRSRLRSQTSLDPSGVLLGNYTVDLEKQRNVDKSKEFQTNHRGHESYEFAKHGKQRPRTQYSFDVSDIYSSQDLSAVGFQMETDLGYNLGSEDDGESIGFSGPLLLQSQKIDELLLRHESQICQAVRKSRMQRGIQRTDSTS